MSIKALKSCKKSAPVTPNNECGSKYKMPSHVEVWALPGFECQTQWHLGTPCDPLAFGLLYNNCSHMQFYLGVKKEVVQPGRLEAVAKPGYV